MSPLVALTLLLTQVGRVQADTVLPDTLRPSTGHTFWLTAEFSPYLVDTTAFLLPGDTLRATPGAVVLFEGTAALIVQGTLLVEGSRDSLVRFDLQEGGAFRWQGIQLRHVIGQDSTQSIIRFAHINMANTVLNMSSPAPSATGVSAQIEHCLFTNASLGLICFTPGRYLVRNCVFDEISTFSLYSGGAWMDVRNNIFLPHSVNTWNYGLMLFNTEMEIAEHVQYNCFYGGPTGAWSNFIASYRTGDTEYTFHVPDFTHVVADPLLDEGYYPEDGSPIIDAGDPDILDPDQTISDMGVFYALGEVAPCRILTDPTPVDWVVGFPYLGLIEMEAYPPATWTLVEGPPGLSLSQLNRDRLAISWPVDAQQTGQFTVRVRGVNQIENVVHRDSLEAVLDFTPNHPPRMVQVQPCSDGDCLDQRTVVVDHLSAGTAALVRLRMEDEDAPRLGASQQYEFHSRLNGSTRPVILADSMWLDLVLDTTQVVLDTWFTDGQATDSLLMVLEPRYTLLAGDVSGVIGASTGAVYLTGPLHVPVGQSLIIEPGSSIVAGEGRIDEWLLDVEGSLILEGTAESPLSFQSLATHTRSSDRRPPFLRIQQGAEVTGLAHAQFIGFSTAVQLEHLEGVVPFIIDQCLFARTRTGVLAVDSPVQITACRFETPADSLQLGSSAIYLAGSQGNRVQNNLFLNPIVGLSAVDAEVLVANNSFLLVPRLDPVFNLPRWPQLTQLGFGRMQVLNSSLNVRNNLFQWRSPLFGDSLTNAQLPDYLAGTPRALWLDDASSVRADYNWFDCRNGWLIRQGDPVLNISHMTAFNDSSRLVSDLRSGNGRARVDEQSGFRLYADSPLIDAGDPAAQWADAFDGSRCDIGWLGGPLVAENGYTPVSGHDGGGGPVLAELPQRFRLRPPWPNPFNPRTRIEVELDRPGRLDLRVHDVLGREVAVLADGNLEPGVYQMHLDAGAWASGTYFARARFAGETQTVKLLLVK